MGYGNLIEKPKDAEIDFEILDSFLNASMTSTGQEEFYTTKDEQTQKLIDLHMRMMTSQRTVYATTLLLPINDFAKQLGAYMLLKNSKVLTRDEKIAENEILMTMIKDMPTNRAYKVFAILQGNKVNNQRTRWLANQFVMDRKNLEFEALKYKKWLKKIIIHNHLKPMDGQEEVFAFIFEKKKRYSNPLFNAYLKAKTDPKAVYKLPYSIALGFKALHQIPDAEFMEKIKGKMTTAEKMRVQNTAEKVGVKVEVNYKEYTPIKLNKYFRVATTNIPKKEDLFNKSCAKMAKDLPFEFGKIAIVIDDSGSMGGSKEKKDHPIAVAESISGILENIGEEVKVFRNGEFLKSPIGDTNLSALIMKALKEYPDLLVILSDGYENVPVPGMSEQILEAYMKKVDTGNKTLILHINPVFAPEAENIKKIAAKVQSFGIRAEKHLYLILLLAVIEQHNLKQFERVLKEVKAKVKPIKKKKKVKA